VKVHTLGVAEGEQFNAAAPGTIRKHFSCVLVNTEAKRLNVNGKHTDTHTHTHTHTPAMTLPHNPGG
jgi:hypothetical protein